MTTPLQTAQKPIRAHVFDILLPFELGRKGVHAEDRLETAFSDASVSAVDRRFATYLTYGVLRDWFVLEQVLLKLSKFPLEKTDPRIRVLARMGLYQLAKMESVPDYAAVSETMSLAESIGCPTKSRGFLNAVLQTFIRQQKILPDDLQAAYPTWWVERLRSQYSVGETEQILETFRSPKTLTLRINTLKTSIEDFKKALAQNNIAFEQSNSVAEVLRLGEAVGSPRELPGFADGWFVVQDESSAQVARFLDPKPGETVLEIGAAPGMKTTHMAALMQNTGKIIAVDTVKKRLKLVEENCTRLGVSIIEPVQVDLTNHPHPAALQAPSPINGEGKTKFDRILVDAPCSGTGTIGKHPEIILSLNEKDFASHAKLQLSLLNAVLHYLKPGGVLVYSTCSIDESENQDVIAEMLQQHANLKQLEEIKIRPDKHQDGFYMSKILNN